MNEKAALGINRRVGLHASENIGPRCMSERLSERGLAVIVALGILALLALIGITFATMMRIELSAARGYIDHVAAKLVARSGIEHAISAVRGWVAGRSADPFDNTTYQASEHLRNPWAYVDPADFSSYDPSLPLENAIHPSLKTGEVTIDSGTPTRVGYSGTVKPSYEDGMNFYSLKVLDCASMLYVNGPDTNDHDPDPRVAVQVAPLTPQVREMLNRLSEIRTRGRITDLGDRISSYRVSLGRNLYLKQEILQALGNDHEAFDAIKDFVTCYAFVDNTTLFPPRLQHDGPENPNIVYDRGDSYAKVMPEGRNAAVSFSDFSPYVQPLAVRVLDFFGVTSIACCSSDRLFGNYHPGVDGTYTPRSHPSSTPGCVEYAIQPRAPVNINTASEDVLRCVLEGITGYYLDRSDGRNTAFMGRIKRLSIDGALATLLAREIIRYRDRTVGGFYTWKQFDKFLEDLPDHIFGSKAYFKRRLINANVNPNSRLSKFNPDKVLGVRFGDTDKSDLTNWTTEFCFNSMGYFQIESIGRVCGPSGPRGRRVKAEVKMTSIVKLYDVYKHSTQQNFEESITVRDSIFTYPENICDYRPLEGCALSYDGYVSVATHEGGIFPEEVTFYAPYRETLGAVAGCNRPIANEGPADEGRSIIAPPGGVTKDQSELFVDGIFCHETRRHRYSHSDEEYGYEGNMDEYVRYRADETAIRAQGGTLELWVKPTWNGSEVWPDPRDSRTFFSIGRAFYSHREWRHLPDGSFEPVDSYIEFYRFAPNWGEVGYGRLALFARNGRLCLYYGDTGVGFFSRWFRTVGETNSLYLYDVHWIHATFQICNAFNASVYDISDWEAGTWHHIAVMWDRGSGDARTARAWLMVDGRPTPMDPLIPYKVVNRFDECSIFIGSNRFKDDTTNGFPCNADATIDEVRIYERSDIFDRNGFPLPSRYHGEGSFAAAVPVRRGGRIGFIAWTAYIPGYDGAYFNAAAHDWQVSAEIRNRSGQVVEIPTSYGDGRGYPVGGMTCDDGENIYYTIQMRAKFDFGLVEAPIIDDVTISILSEPQMLSSYKE